MCQQLHDFLQGAELVAALNMVALIASVPLYSLKYSALKSLVCSCHYVSEAYCGLHLAGRLDAELLQVTRRVSAVLQTLPKDITPVNLEELRRVKQVLVELESKADTLRCADDTSWRTARSAVHDSLVTGCQLLLYAIDVH
jgi:hypothetical protein